MRRGTGAAGVALLVLVLGGSADAAAKGKAPDAPPEARAKKGLALQKARKFPAALTELKAAHTATQSWELLLNIGQCEHELQKYSEAVKSFRAFLEQGGSKVTAEQRGIVENELAIIKDFAATVTITVTGGPADVTIDGEPVGRSPFKEPFVLSAGAHAFGASRGSGGAPVTTSENLIAGKRFTVVLGPSAEGSTRVKLSIDAQPIGALVNIDGKPAGAAPLTTELDAGAHVITAEAENHESWRKEVTLEPGQKHAIHIAMERIAAPTTKGKPPVAGLVVTGLGVLGLGGSIALSAIAGAESAQVNTLFSEGGRWDGYYDARQSSGERAETWSILSGIGSGLLIGVGVIVTLASLPPAEPSGEVDVAPEGEEKATPEEDEGGGAGAQLFFTPMAGGGLYGGLTIRW